MYSPQGYKLFDAHRNYFGRQAYACFMMSTGPAAPFFECWAVVDDFGNLRTVQSC